MILKVHALGFGLNSAMTPSLVCFERQIPAFFTGVLSLVGKFSFLH